MRVWRFITTMAQACFRISPSLRALPLPRRGLLHSARSSLTTISMACPDIFAANGHVADDIGVIQPTIHYAEPLLLFRNRGNGKFEDMSQKVGTALEAASCRTGRRLWRLRQ